MTRRAAGPSPQRPARGFSLFELAVCLAIIAVLAALALPHYRNHLRISHQRVAETALLQCASSLERWFAAHDTYSGAPLDATECSRSPAQGSAVYQISGQLGDTQWQLQAHPLSGGPEHNSGALQLDSSGQRSWDANANGQIEASEASWP